jgi:hypothetical protein
MEQAFLISQSGSTPDPFEYTVTYYGQSQSGFGFLGYEVDSLCHLANNAQSYWELYINNVPSQSGEDSTFPPAGATISWVYTAINPAATAQSPRHEAHRRRLERRQKAE